MTAVIDEAVLQALYNSGIQFDVCCTYGGGFRVRLGTPATGFSAAVVVANYAAVVQQLCAMALLKYPELRLRAKARIVWAKPVVGAGGCRRLRTGRGARMGRWEHAVEDGAMGCGHHCLVSAG